jgi:hypothetical protein
MATSPRNPNFLLWMIQENVTGKETCNTAKGLETLDPKAEAKGSLESPKETPPPSPNCDQHQPTPMGEQPWPEHKIELCTPGIVDLPIINLEDVRRPFKIKISTIRMVQHSTFIGKEDPNIHL